MRTMTKTYVILATIAALALCVFFLLPDRHFEDLVFPLNDKSTVFAYNDQIDGGESETTFLKNDSSLNFSCTLGLDTTKSAWCGLLFDISNGKNAEYRNWLFVDSIIFDIEAIGTREILVKVWTFDPDVTNIKNPRTYRLLMKEMPIGKGRRRISLPMEHFYTPDFWYSESNIDPTLNKRHQETVARLEIAPGWNRRRGETFSLKIYSVKAKGVSNIAFGILMIIMLVLMIVAIGRKHSYEKDKVKK